MKVYLVVVLFAVSAYWFKDPLVDLAKRYLDEPTTADLHQIIPPKKHLDRAAKEMNRFIKPTVSPKVKVDKNELKKRLTPLEYHITQEKGTERPFSGKYVRVNDNGMYTCVVCNEELFSTDDQYYSGCGWPAFHTLKNLSKVTLTPDTSHIGSNLLLLIKNKDRLRTEVSCSNCGAHLGHVFDEKNQHSNTRFCINSASLKFKKENNNNEPSTRNNEN